MSILVGVCNLKSLPSGDLAYPPMSLRLSFAEKVKGKPLQRHEEGCLLGAQPTFTTKDKGLNGLNAPIGHGYYIHSWPCGLQNKEGEIW